MKRLIIIALLLASCQAEKQKEIDYTGFDFTGLMDSVKTKPINNHNGKKLWGYL